MNIQKIRSTTAVILVGLVLLVMWTMFCAVVVTASLA